MMVLWAQIKAWSWAIAGAVFAVLGVTSVYFKKKAERVAQERDTLVATVHAERQRKKIEKEEKKALQVKEQEIRENLKNGKSADNLTDSNDW